MPMNGITRSRTLAALVLTGAAVLSAGAQAPAIKRTILQRADLSAPGREAVLSLAELPGGSEIPRHTHPGEEISYVLEGEMILEIEGRPPLTVKAGDSFIIEAGKPHGGRTVGTSPIRVVGTYVLQKGQPLATPVN